MVAHSIDPRPAYTTTEPVEPKRVGFLLGLGVLLVPWLFAWLLLRPGYSARARFFGLGWSAMVIMVAYGHHDKIGQLPGQATLPAATGNTAPATAAAAAIANPGAAWQYSYRIDQMRGETSSYAAISSTNTLDFGFPYSGGSTGELTLRRTGEDVAVMLEIDKGQFTCFNGEADKVVMKFDAGEVLHYSCDRTADGSSNIVFLGPEQMILRQLRDAQQLVIEAQFFQEGSRQLTFHVAGLKW